jgi:hypothetical protein
MCGPGDLIASAESTPLNCPLLFLERALISPVPLQRLQGFPVEVLPAPWQTGHFVIFWTGILNSLVGESEEIIYPM